MNEWNLRVAAVCGGLLLLGFAIGAVVGQRDAKTIDSRTVPTLATVTLAGNGMVYCPTDGSAPKVAPCLNPPPTTTAP